MSWNRVDLAKVHRLFYPQVPIVVTVRVKGRVGAMPAIWCMPLSFNPPLIGIAFAPEHETYRMIVKAGAFAVNWLDYSYARQVAELGEISGREYDTKLASVGLTLVAKTRSDQPLIKQAAAALECRVQEERRTGTHQLVTAEVVSAFAASYFRDYWDFSKYDPLLYAGTTDSGGRYWIFMSTKGRAARVPFKHAD